MTLTPNFDSTEFLCRHCGAGGIRLYTVQALQALRDAIGKPISIQSGYRCARHPVEAAKVRPGYHARGMAADIRVAGMTPREVLAVAETIPQFNGFGVSDEQDYLHVDTRSTPARWCYRSGREVPFYDVPEKDA